MNSEAQNTSLGKKRRAAPRERRVASSKKRKVARTIEQTDEGWEEVGSPSILSTIESYEPVLPTPETSSLAETQSENVDFELESEPAPAPAEEEPLDPRDIFPFMKLPAELRVHIYRMALQRPDPLLLHVERPPDRFEGEPGSPKAGLFNILRASEHHPGPSRPPIIPETRIARQRSPPPRLTLDPPSCCSFHALLKKPDPNRDNISPVVLRLNSFIYKESRQVLYADNTFLLSLSSGVYTLSTLHQRSRSLIKHVSLTIPSHHDILDGFADLVRLGLRYCWGLKKFTITLQASLPDDRILNGATSVYANAFHILRWLPKGCKVVLEGNVSEVVRRVVAEEGRLQEELDETSYLKRQHQMPERH